jgi:hypothetical protein
MGSKTGRQVAGQIGKDIYKYRIYIRETGS